MAESSPLPEDTPVSLDGGESAVPSVQPLVLGAPNARGVVPRLAGQPLLRTEHGHGGGDINVLVKELEQDLCLIHGDLTQHAGLFSYPL